MPPVQTALPQQSSSVIVSAASAITSTRVPPPRQPRPPSAPELPEISPKPTPAVTPELVIKINPPKSPSPTLSHVKPQAAKHDVVVTEPRKKLTTLEAYTTDSSKKSPLEPVVEASGSNNSPSSADVVDDSSTPGISDNTISVEQTTVSEGQASEFSGLVSYFSSQHDDYNT